MHILISGGTGLIGAALTKFFLGKGCQVTILTRSNKKKISGASMVQDLKQIKRKIDVVINLAGKRLDENRWSNKVKEEIYNSRVTTTQNLVKYINSLKEKPKVFLSGSAIGYYGNDKAKIFNESSLPLGESFTTKLCYDWEKEASGIDKNVRLCFLRTGIVLSKDGGALPKMALPTQFYLGASLGAGNQYMSWIHIYDLIRAIDYVIENKSIRGPVNLTSPNPCTNQEFTHILAQALGTKAFLKIPSFVAKILFGEMAEELLLKGQKIYPKKLLENNFKFKFANLDKALADIFPK